MSTMGRWTMCILLLCSLLSSCTAYKQLQESYAESLYPGSKSVQKAPSR